MRYVGEYKANCLPDYDKLVGLHTDAVKLKLSPLRERVIGAIEEYLEAWPEITGLAPIELNKEEHTALTDAYNSRTAAIKRELISMKGSLKPEYADLCPFCNLDSGAELDHFLPKDVFAEFSLLGLNLVPICSVCNKSKASTYRDENNSRIFLLPLHDMSHDDVVIGCNVTFSPELLVEYEIDEQAAIDEDELAICIRHFRRLKLAERYAKRARSFLAQAKLKLRGTPEHVCRRIWASTIVDGLPFEPTNSWRSALFRDAINSIDEAIEWFQLG